MDKNEFFIISTTEEGAPTMTRIMLNKVIEKKENFGGTFYPIIGINYDKRISVIMDENFLTDDICIYIIDDMTPLDPSFLEKTAARIQKQRILYLLLHNSENSYDDVHQDMIFDSCKEFLGRIRVAKSHHTSITDKPEYALGYGLEKVAEAILKDPHNVDVSAFNEAIEYLRKKPAYSSPYKEALIHLYKSLSVILIKLKGNKWNEVNFKEEKGKWNTDKQNKNKLTVNMLGNLMHKEKDGIMQFVSREDFINNMEFIKNELIKISSDQ